MSTLIETIAAQQRAHSADNAAIRPFRVSVPEAELTDLRRRITATKFPERETVNDMSQGVPLATVEKLARRDPCCGVRLSRRDLLRSA